MAALRQVNATAPFKGLGRLFLGLGSYRELTLNYESPEWGAYVCRYVIKSNDWIIFFLNESTGLIFLDLARFMFL